MKTPIAKQLLAENAELRARLDEAEQTLDAIRSGEVDAVVVSGREGEQIFSLVGAESIYRLVVETMKEAAVTVTFDGTILFCNAQFGQFVQRPMEQIVGRRLHEFVAPDYAPSVDSLLMASGEQPVKQRLVLRDSQEQPVPVHISAHALNQPEGPSICVVATDLTELENSNDLIRQLRRQQKALRDSERRERERAEELATFLDAAPTPVIIVHDVDGVHMTGNRAADELLRHGHGEELSLSAPPETRPRHFKAVKDGRELRTDELPAQRAARDEQVRDFEFSLVFDDGTIRDVLGYGTPLRDADGRPRGAVHVLVDITERRRAEESLRELNATLESKVAQRTAELQHRARQLQKMTLEVSLTEDRERRRLAEILHDDLQQIIAGAKFHLCLLKKRVKYDDSLQGIASRIDDILTEAMEKSRGLSHELSPNILHHADFTETLDWLANQVRAKHGLVVRVQADGPAKVQSDAIRTFLYKTAQELLFNVVKHARTKKAGIRVRRFGSYLCLSVSDRGRGFDPQGLREAAGFGLLSIRERIELLGGRMKIRSAKGKGSTLFVVVPDNREPQDRVESRSSLPTSHAAHRTRLRVLLADDHKIVREGLRSLLSDQPDVEVVGEAAHSREAVDLALRMKPDVIIMDVSMPLIEGDAATREIKAHLPKTRIIAFSTYNEPQTMEKMCQAGAESYVLKTASSDELLAAIRGQGFNK